MIFARKIYKIPEFYMMFARKMLEFYIIIARKIFFPNFLPPSPTPMGKREEEEMKKTEDLPRGCINKELENYRTAATGYSDMSC